MNTHKKRPDTEDPENLLKLNPVRTYGPMRVVHLVTLAICLMTLILGGLGLHAVFPVSAHSASGSPKHNIIYRENQKPGTTRWYSRELQKIKNAIGSPNANDDAPSDKGSPRAGSAWTDSDTRGYASATSINHGDSINFYVGTTFPSYNMEIYRMGWYGGTGSTLVQTISNLPGQNQPIPPADPTTGLLQLNWSVSYTLQTDTSWVTGVYLAKLIPIGTGGTVSYIPFVIRDDSSTADILYVLPVATYQAYNNWGGQSLYEFNSNNSTRAYQVSFDRPYAGDSGTGNFFTGDYNMIRFLEKNSYNIAYATSVDLQANPNLLANHKLFLSNYHDEYWSMGMRTNLQNALSQGKSATFFDADSIYWQIRYDNSSLGVANRVITCYKNVTLDPVSQTNPSLTTTLWRNSPVNMPENALLGEMYESQFNWGVTFPWVVANANHWIYNGTGLNNGDSISGVVGYEYDKIWNNGLTPAGLVTLSSSPVTDTYGNHSTANGSIYTVSPGNGLVFDAGTVYWEWKLDDNTINAHGADPRIQQMTINVLNAGINGVPTPTPTPSPTLTPTPTLAPSPTFTPTPTPSPTPTATYQSTVLSDNPMAYWRLGEASGATQAVDTSGNGYTATYNSGVSFGAPGAVVNDTNTAISSNGTGKITPPAFSTVTNFTIEGWTYLTDPSWNSASNYNNALYGRWGDLRVLIRPGASNTSAYALGYFSVWLNGTEYSLQPVNKSLTNTNQWVHWAVVRNGSSLTVYRNGAQVGQRTDLPASATANISGTALVQDTSYYLKGSVDEIALYNYALTATRVQAHYNCGLGAC